MSVKQPSRKPSDSPSDTVPSIVGSVQQSRPATTLTDMGMLSHYSALPNAEGAGLMTTLDLGVRANVVLVQNALHGESESLWDQKPERIIRVADLIAHYTSYVSEETGEEQSGPMLTLLGPDGVFHTGSQYAFRSLQDIAFLQGRPPWIPPIMIRAVRVKSRNKREFQSLVLVE